MKAELKKELEDRARVMRRHILEMVGGKEGKVGHLGGSSSAADLVAALYFYKMNVDPKNPQKTDRDRFLLSKGHAALVQYAALAELGYFPLEELQKVKSLGAMLQGHPDMTKTPGIEANTGSLGMGLSIGLGIALGQRMNKSASKTYVMLGDGELGEGQVWEAAMAAASYEADNLIAIVDHNKLQAMGAICDRLEVGNIAAKFEAFGWHVIELDGHSMTEICAALDAADAVTGKPIALVAHTIKGKHVSFAEGNPAFHNAGLSAEQYEQACKDIDSYVCN